MQLRCLHMYVDSSSQPAIVAELTCQPSQSTKLQLQCCELCTIGLA